MANDCMLQGRITLQPGTKPDDVKAALLEAAKRREADFTPSEIDELLSADEMDENRINIEGGVADVCIQLRGTGGFLSREAAAVTAAFDALSARPGGLVMTDLDLAANSEGAQMLYCVGATKHDKAVAKILYAMDEAAPYLRAAGIANESIQRVRESLIGEITPPEKRAEDLAVAWSEPSDGPSLG